MFRARLALAELKGDLNQSQAGGRSGPPSFNLILTKRALHLIPRNQEEVGIPGLEGDGLGRLSVNAMGEYSIQMFQDRSSLRKALVFRSSLTSQSRLTDSLESGSFLPASPSHRLFFLHFGRIQVSLGSCSQRRPKS